MTAEKSTDLDAIVVGAGFAGIYMLHKLRNELGLSVRAFDRAGGVGGTWYWNRYPGAMSDSEGFIYQYSFDRDLLREWTWNKRYLTRDEILGYLESVVERYDLGRDIRLHTSVESIVLDEESGVWTVATGDGAQVTARYVVTALGPLSTSHFPDIPGRDDFGGRLVHTGAWPEDLDVEGKRVGVIGTGSTGTQFVCAAAKTAAHLTVFQRTPQYNVPSGNHPLDEEYFSRLREDYDRIWEQAKSSVVACGFEESRTPAMSVSEEERHRVFQESWDRGNGFRFMFGTFSDIIFNPEANEAAAEFIRAKIRETVKDPETARRLQPTDYYAKRPICNEDYYESFNRDNVSLVSLRETPIREITPTGAVTEDGTEHELDVLVFATGFEAVEGSYRLLDVRGRGGESIEEHWGQRPSSHLGMSVSGFPNLFMVYGPCSVFSNLPTAIETQVEWISELIGTMEERGLARAETTREAEESWTAVCEEIAGHSLFPKVDSWIFGANIPGRERRVLFYFAGLHSYRRRLREIAEAGYEGLVFEGERSTAPA
ncbi:NAD(P)/FAD-dependent oxidoreductase [Nocardiopsis sp. CNT312]|uniref:flavin-containing monooxygenase n=1 Tax=Nocardiopsis sp. CNT312 TaxID=1137268 RepID=UPI00048C87AF|nr:NAD(P)/FAD-dependent oxidoreductase [Nocardiopsis sp. CNT312]